MEDIAITLREIAGKTSELVALEEEVVFTTRNTNQAILGVPRFRIGSDGFRDFGAGTFARLHGEEGVFTPQQINDLLRVGATVGSNQINNAARFESPISALAEALAPDNVTRFANALNNQRLDRFIEALTNPSRRDVNFNIRSESDGANGAIVSDLRDRIRNMIANDPVIRAEIEGVRGAR